MKPFLAIAFQHNMNTNKSVGENPGVRNKVISRMELLISVIFIILASVFPQPSAECRTIHDAAYDGDVKEVDAILKQHPNWVDTRNNRGKTALHIACENGNFEMVKCLVGKGADPNACIPYIDEPVTPIGLAAESEHKEIVDYLLANGGERPLNVAVFINDAETVSEILDTKEIKDLNRPFYRHEQLIKAVK